MFRGTTILKLSIHPFLICCPWLLYNEINFYRHWFRKSVLSKKGRERETSFLQQKNSGSWNILLYLIICSKFIFIIPATLPVNLIDNTSQNNCFCVQLKELSLLLILYHWNKYTATYCGASWEWFIYLADCELEIQF